jgi:menaquinone-dependent protoporphyrinogen oxidase
MRVLVAVASKHGSTTEIGEEIAGRLRTGGHDVQFADIEHVSDVDAHEAFVLGSAVYMGHWMKTVPQFVERHEKVISKRPTWLFSSGPIGHDAPPEVGKAQETEPLIAKTRARDYASFAGRVEPAELGFMEKLAVRAVHAPAGDYRDWEAIRDWADMIAVELKRLNNSSSDEASDQ